MPARPPIMTRCMRGQTIGLGRQQCRLCQHARPASTPACQLAAGHGESVALVANELVTSSPALVLVVSPASITAPRTVDSRSDTPDLLRAQCSSTLLGLGIRVPTAVPWTTALVAGLEASKGRKQHFAALWPPALKCTMGNKAPTV